MAAGVHAAFIARLVLEAVHLVHRQAIHVRAQRDAAAAAGLLAADDADHAGLGDAAMHLDAPGGQLVGDQARGAVLFEGELGVRVDVAPQ